jgi:hypothetical protein
MRKLILVHGRAQEGKDPQELKWNWVQALKVGLIKSDLLLPLEDSEIAFPYYGDLLDRLVYGTGEDDAEPEVITRGRPADVAELNFKIELLDAMRKKVGLTDEQVREASIGPTVQKGPLNWEWVQAILRGFDKYVPEMSGTAVNLFTHDVFVYLHRPGVRDEIDSVVRRDIPTRQQCVLVGHSLGTVVAYSILRRDGDELEIPQYITLGSPLALSVIQEAFDPLRYPPCVGRWYNAMDERDVVALHPLESPHFNVTPRIENKKNVDNFTSNRHGIAGYLTDKDVAKKIYDSLLA